MTDMNPEPVKTLSGAILAGLSCRCPRCGEGKLYTGFLTLRTCCDACGLNYSFADSGDGPAIFIMFFAGFIVVGAALVTEALYHPPYWVHAVLWLPLILILTLGPLRPMKGLMIALQFYHKAEESRFGGTGEP
jgi:uncharacterized protein (DUF983 family)